MESRKVVLIDNYDSFTYNLAQYAQELGACVVVARNDEIDVAGIRSLTPTHLIISPGPGGPEDAGISCEAVLELQGELPILGVCLGHQVIGHVMGGRVVTAPRPVHGSTSMIHHDGNTIFAGIESPFDATRYHSLVVDPDSIPDCLEVTCTSDDGLVMGLRHREAHVEGVQFHPESILTTGGKKMLANFLAMTTGKRDMLRETVLKVARREDLGRDEARRAALALLGGEVPDSVMGGLLVGLKTKGETEDEIVGFAQGMREVKVSIAPSVETLVDTCGTGGDRSGTFNISTAAAIITAAAGVPVAKHGNRGVSSGCGSADVLEALGVEIAMKPEDVKACIEEVGIGFMFAPAFHPAMKRVMQTRRDLGVPTIFNILGPLTNPAGARAQVLGVNNIRLLPVMGRALNSLGCARAFVLHGRDGLDEFTLSARTAVCEVDNGNLREYELAPEDLGLSRAEPAEVAGGDAARNAERIREVLLGRQGPALDICLANAAFAIVAGGLAKTPAEGVALARRAVQSGKAQTVLERLVSYSGTRSKG